MKLLAVAVPLALFLAESGWAQSGSDRRSSFSDRKAERQSRRSGGLLEAIFGKRSAPQGRVVRSPETGASPRAEVEPDESGGESAQPGDAEGAVDSAIEEMRRHGGEGVSRDMVSSASKMLEGREKELEPLARSLKQDPNKLLEEGRRVLEDPEASASAREALRKLSETSPEGAIPASSLEKVKQAVREGKASEDLLSQGKKLISENPNLLEQGKNLLARKSELASTSPGGDRSREEPEGRMSEAEIRSVLPKAAATNAPLPPWVGSDVPLPSDPVVEPIPRPEIEPEQVTRITAEFARFDANTNVVTFEENVELDHHEFDLSCQILVAELKPDENGKKPDANAAKARASAGGIRRAEAKGFVIIEKISPEGKIQVAKSRHAVYDAESGDVILSDFPQLQDGNSLISGSTQTTKIYLRRNGKYEVKGLAEYEIVPEGDPLKTFQP